MKFFILEIERIELFYMNRVQKARDEFDLLNDLYVAKGKKDEQSFRIINSSLSEEQDHEIRNQCSSVKSPSNEDTSTSLI